VSNVEKRLGDILLEHGFVTQEQVKAAVAEEGRSGRPAWRVLIDRGELSERDLVRARAIKTGLEFVDLSTGDFEPEAVALVPEEVARRQLALPVRVGDDGRVIVAMGEPRNHLAIDELSRVTGREIVPAAAFRGDMGEAIDRAYDEPLFAPVAAQSGSTAVDDGAAAAPAAPAAPPPAAPAPAAPGPAAANGAPGGVTSFGPEDLPMVEAPEVEAPAEEETPALKEPSLADFLLGLIDSKGSDLHLTAGLPPMIRINGDLQPLKGYRVMLPKDLQELIYAMLTQKQRESFENNLELDVSYSLPGKARFRVNVFQQRDTVGSVMRLIPCEIKSLEQLGLPPAVSEFAKLKRGLVLVTGITGSGKSTTLAGLIDIVNSERADHIMTVEDPIEFLHKHKRSVVNQREVGTDTMGFQQALKHVLRQDPDVILVGEMRDLETISTALTAAETGHLVFGTLHTQDAPQSIDRVIDVFPPHQQQQVRVQLAGTLAGVVSQQLMRTTDKKGRCVAAEVLIATPAVRNLIREGKTHQIYTSMQAGGKYGMQVMDQHLAHLVKAGKITYENALEHCHKVEEFNRLTGRG
jgi:twitching motility protein PilT